MLYINMCVYIYDCESYVYVNSDLKEDLFCLNIQYFNVNIIVSKSTKSVFYN